MMSISREWDDESLPSSSAGAGAGLLYWLVRHPRIHNFSWSQTQTPASSPRFLTLTVISYLALTWLFSNLRRRTSPLPRQLLRPICAIHNFFLLSLSFTMALGCALSILTTRSYRELSLQDVVCFPRTTAPTGPLFFWGYIFYLSKMAEFLDTLLIILSSSASRLTFLHVYHHAMVVIMCYVCLNSSQSSFPMVLVTNCGVHVIMYTYYLLCTLGIRPRWKRMVTDCQILQFWSTFALLAVLLYYHFSGDGCSGMRSWAFNIFFISTLLLLFTDFHTKNYTSSAKPLKST